MISIIVSSYKDHDFEQFKKNVERTVGIAYEIIKVHNPGLMGICEAYNKGASKAKFSLLCFAHEDILFLTQDWGQQIVDVFKDNLKIDVIGFAGSKYKPAFITGWTTGISSFDVDNVTQIVEGIYKKPSNTFEDSLSEVVTLDGLCLILTTETWRMTKFDEQIKGYHFYDIEFTARLSKLGYKLFVTHTINVVHKSLGNFNTDWLKKAIAFHKKFDVKVATEDVKDTTSKLDRQIKHFWIYRLSLEDIHLVEYLKLISFNYREHKVALKILLKRIVAYVIRGNKFKSQTSDN